MSQVACGLFDQVGHDPTQRNEFEARRGIGLQLIEAVTSQDLTGASALLTVVIQQIVQRAAGRLPPIRWSRFQYLTVA